MPPGQDGSEEQLNVYDPEGRVVGAAPRGAAKASGHAVGAVNVLILNERNEVLLQQRPRDKENGGLWDKSVGGHVSAGEEFDHTAVREAGEELFDDAASSRVRLLPGQGPLRADERPPDVDVALRRMGLQLNLRDVRRTPSGEVRNVVYHVAIYAGRTALPIDAFAPQAEEIAGLRYAPPSELDALLASGGLAPNMAFLWLSHAYALLRAPS
jgi:isopentenyldiphosphate isomerase